MIKIFYSSIKEPKISLIKKAHKGAWLHVEAPTEKELQQLAKQFDLDIDLLNDGIDINESPRVELEDGKLYIFTRYILPESQKETTSPMLIIYTESNVITICRSAFDRLEKLSSGKIPTLTSQRTKLGLQILSEINQGFKLRINEVSRRVSKMRSQLSRDHIDSKEFLSILDVEEDLNDILWVLEPMGSVLSNLLSGRYLKLYEEDKDLIEDLSLGTDELILLTRARLQSTTNIREAYNTLATNNLNRVFRALTTTAIFVSIATMVTGFYGMNIKMPLADHLNAFWLVLGVAAILMLLIAWIFRRNRWL